MWGWFPPAFATIHGSEDRGCRVKQFLARGTHEVMLSLFRGYCNEMLIESRSFFPVSVTHRAWSPSPPPLSASSSLLICYLSLTSPFHSYSGWEGLYVSDRCGECQQPGDKMSTCFRSSGSNKLWLDNVDQRSTCSLMYSTGFIQKITRLKV